MSLKVGERYLIEAEDDEGEVQLYDVEIFELSPSGEYVKMRFGNGEAKWEKGS